MKLARGMLVRTSYDSVTYRIETIARGCTCPSYLDTINNPGRTTPTAPHVHMVLTWPDGTGRYWLSHYDEETLRSVVSNDHLEIVHDPDPQPVQLDLFEPDTGSCC